MKDFWEKRYGEKAYAYGEAPNTFFKEMANKYLSEGKVLFPAEGEGRNAVYAATRGLEAVAFDISSEGRKKALALATKHGVDIRYEVGPLDEVDLGAEKFDAAVLIFAHFPANIRDDYHQKIAGMLAPGGYVIFEAFSKNHLKFSRENPQAGGPKDPEMLFDIQDIKNEFPGFEILLLEEKEVTLDEGAFHRGKSSVIRFVGRRRE
ncbi:class I SAM-dependent methyltransferase [Robertkochia sediminum]|uniref:class I SAM-dependent methyltransferase n=1 Tax=Robertkochia sediminum TaxID=2785326 RepID=UPI00193264DD|nr:class I SAM-dependent methyltransferase [Robertkochia sediminum]MBL7473859.1 class I SAM-dependent methyltransferase [Robertkochia sediminum]